MFPHTIRAPTKRLLEELAGLTLFFSPAPSASPGKAAVTFAVSHEG